MEAIDRECYGQGEKPRPPAEGPEEEPPVIEAFLVQESEHEHGFNRGLHIAPLHMEHLFLLRMVILQKLPYPGIIILGGIDGIDDLLVSGHEAFIAHLRDEVHRKVRVVPGYCLHQPVLGDEAIIELCTAWCVQKADHGGSDPALLDELDHPFEDRCRILIKTYDKAGLHLKAEFLYFPYTGYQVAVPVRDLGAFVQTLFIRCFDADKDGDEPGRYHHVHKFLVIRQIDGSLGRKVEWVFFYLHPGDEWGQYLRLQLCLVADEVVIDEEDSAFPSQGQEFIQFRYYLVGFLCSGYTAEQ